MRQHRLYNIIMSMVAVAAAMLSLCSCEHKELCYHHPHTATIRLEFDWRDAPDANPKGMTVYFYPMQGVDAPVRCFNFIGTGGGEIEIRTGKYRVICYNNDTEMVLLRGTEKCCTHEAFTRSGDLFESTFGHRAGNNVPRAVGAESEPVVVSPDMMWGCNATDVEISETGVSYVCVPLSMKDEWEGRPPVTDEQVITLYPHEQVCTYTYEIRHVKGLEHVTQMCGSLSSMAPSLLLCDESLGRQRVTIPFEAQAGDATTIVGKFLTFGHHEENPEPHLMVLYVWMDDGKKYCYGIGSEHFNVTEQVHSAPDKRHVHLIIDGLDLPQHFDNVDIDTTVDDWQEVNEDIHL